ncbi:GNAT family N-acetyltransferase [Flavobacterium sp.]|uniref:GNAT family N-acetyltransferase n=1 Tax=Flavobacterium sp. TaxID=239 RepID=UPI0025CFD8AA|nr:GNAT family N-acetyltransferase [Flavobacterium sp.]
MYKIQEATTAHLQEIVTLWTKLMNIHKELDAHYFSETDNSKNEYKTEIEWFINHDSNRVYVALIDNEVIGFATAQLIFFSNSHYNMNSHCSIGDIMIEEKYQHLGIGKAFLEEVKLWAQSVNIKTIQLHVFSKNEKALGFFKNQGFEDLFAILELKI